MSRVAADPSLIPRPSRRACACTRRSRSWRAPPRATSSSNGAQIKEGDRVLLWYLASNRDESKFENPHEFDIDRHNREEHQAFGARGRHFCLGAALARLELTIWIEETLKRMPDLELDGECTRVRALFLNQYNSIPVRRG